MIYEELMKRVLDGRSVNATAKAIGVPQKSLDEYVKGKNLPDCERAIVLARAAGVSIEEAVLAIAAKKAELRPERVHSFLRSAIAAAMTLAVGVNLFLTPSPAEAAPAKAYSRMSDQTYLYYVKLLRLRLGRFGRKISAWLATALRPATP